ncbi:calcium-binding protein, partial [Metapseudomonas otitidis]|uniref:calcium-binding protein n=1 Tax=Metapseudomonas otitidis TaxID=319939 RepID=UPI0013DECA68
LRFGQGISAKDIEVRKVGLDIVFVHSNGTDSITLKDAFSAAQTYQSNKTIESIVFADNTTWNMADIIANGIISRGGEAGDTLL